MTALPSTLTLEEQAELLRVLGHPMRLLILTQLRRDERSVGDLAERTGLGLSALSQQLAILRKAMLVTARREAKQVFYSGDPQSLRAAAALVEALADDRLAAGSQQDTPGAAVDTRIGAAMFARVTRRAR